MQSPIKVRHVTETDLPAVREIFFIAAMGKITLTRNFMMTNG